MKVSLAVYSGTGNSLWVARLLAAELGGAAMDPLTEDFRPPAGADAVGLVFPVHIWGLPGRVVNLAHRLGAADRAYLFAVAVNAGMPAATLPQLQRLLRGRGMPLAAGFSVPLPSNYIPWIAPPPAERQAALFASARGRIAEIAGLVARRESARIERGPAWQNPLFSLLYRWAFPHVAGMDAKFLADERCNSCGICARICAAGNIELREGKPAWLHRCEQCFACLQWCPTEAIQYGEKTRERRRYHHPEVSLREMLDLAGGIPGHDPHAKHPGSCPVNSPLAGGFGDT